MARYAGATWRPVPRYQLGTAGSVARRMSRPRRLVLHTAVSSSTSLFDWFNVKGRSTAHFYVAHDGTVEQYVDTAIQSTANLDGNHDSITVESQDIGATFPVWNTSGSDVPAWTPDQVRALAELAAWVHVEHGIPLEPLPSTRPGTRGVGYHRQGIAPWRTRGGEVWSKAKGKVCPGDRRVAQIPTVIRQAVTIAGGKAPDITGDDMTTTPATIPTRPNNDRWKPGTRLAAFTAMGERFVAWLANDEIARKGSTYTPGPGYSTYDDFNVRKVQALMGNAPDPAGKAYLGPRQWKRLFTSERPAGATLPPELEGQSPPQLRPKTRQRRALGPGAPGTSESVRTSERRPSSSRSRTTPRKAPAGPAPAPSLPAKSLFVPGQKHPAFTAMGERLLVWLTSSEIHRAGSVYTPGPRYSIYDARNVRAVQALMGNTPDPVDSAHFGPKQWARLFAEGRPRGAVLPTGLGRSAKRRSGNGDDRRVPVAGQRVTVKFGKPGSWAAGEHTGVDLGSNGDDTIRAVGAGTVVVAGMQGDWGNRVIVRHPNGRFSWYCHLSSIAVRKGQKISRGAVVGVMGETGRTFGKHLHYQESTGGYGYNAYKRPIMLGFDGY